MGIIPIAIILLLLLLLVSERVATMSLLLYMDKKGYTLPSDSEAKECTKKIWKRLLKIK